MAYALSDIVLNNGDLTDEQTIRQITQLSHNENATITAINGSGLPVALGHNQGETMPSSSITVTDSQILELNTNRALAIGYCATAAVSVIPLNVFADCSVLNASSVHGGIQANGPVFLAITSVSGQGANAVEISADLHYLAGPIGAVDCFVHPLTALSSQALTTATLGEQHQFHSAFINGTEIPECNGFTITNNYTVVKKANGGGNFPARLYLKAIETTIEFNTEDISRCLSILKGTKMTSGCVIYLAKKSDDGTIKIADATAVHKSITAAAGVQQSPTLSFTGTEGTGTIKVTIANPNAANSGDTLVVATDIVLP